MSVPTKIKFKDFVKTIAAIVEQKGIACQMTASRGSARRIEVFKKASDKIPYDFRVVHEAKVVYSDDLKKVCAMLDITKSEFEKITDSI